MSTEASPARWLAAWGVHLFTASGAVAGLLALGAIARGDVAAAFWWMAYTLAVDSADGTMARAVGVKQVLPYVDGARLDDCVDYFTYVLVPAFFMVEAQLFPPAVALPVAALVCLASGYGFAQTAAKTPDHYFTGFPSYWNVVAFYLWALEWNPWTNAAITTLLAIGVFVPLRYVYPSRTTTLRPVTIGLALVWGVALLWALWELPEKHPALVRASLAFPAYYVGLSIVLHLRALRA
jgi:phosphatidylcholine synthase